MAFCRRFPSFGDGRRERSLRQAAGRKEQEKAEHDSRGWDGTKPPHSRLVVGLYPSPFPLAVKRLMNCLLCCPKAWFAPCQRDGRQEEDAGTGRGLS